MSTNPPVSNTYQSPTLPDGAYAAIHNPRPTLLTLICVIAIVLGTMGIMNSLFGTVGVFGGRQLQVAFRQPSTAGMSTELQDAQKKLEDDMYGAMQKYWWPLVGGLVLRLLVGVPLLVGGIRTLGLKEAGRKVLLVAFAAALPFELLSAIVQSLLTLEYMTAMNTFAERLTESLPSQAAADGVAKILPVIMRASMIGGLVIQYVLSLAKISFYIYGLFYLQKQVTRALFHSTATLPNKPVAAT